MLQSWFADAELARWVDFPSRRWFDYTMGQPASYPCVAYEGEVPVGFVQYDTKPDGTASFLYYVRPDLRNRGYGRRILWAMLAAPELAGVDVVWCGVDPDNTASLHCLAAVGFTRVEPYPGDPSLLKVSRDRAAARGHGEPSGESSALSGCHQSRSPWLPSVLRQNAGGRPFSRVDSF